MGKKGNSEEEILRVSREAESGDTVVEICRKRGISQQTFYAWKKKYAGLGLNESRESRKQVVAKSSSAHRNCIMERGWSRAPHCGQHWRLTDATSDKRRELGPLGNWNPGVLLRPKSSTRHRY